ncbi:MAG TPA: bifunctional homocysteine S-methyltransferase/methylenetetrahydrofolate reductase, partial [Anaerolineales bacterium]|nr:bifunctional homocysteine S-methyltransferase/methylenetetrahydrofolate reductase [Anaerolineales bacterium]
MSDKRAPAAMNPRDRFAAWLQARSPRLADGAMGTMLHARGVAMGTCFDELNRARPDLVLEIHRQYRRAGAEILETNSFGANVYRLAAHGLEDHLEEINRAAVELARQAADGETQVLIGGSVGPLGVRLAPYGRVRAEQAASAYRRQIAALTTAGVDLLIFETHTDLRELVLAVETAHQMTDLPILASMTYTRDDRSLLGDGPFDVAKALDEAGADVIGANCSGGPAQLLRLLQQMQSAAPERRLSLMPNAGWPERHGGRILYAATPEYFADYARLFDRMGAAVIGGCCGTTPEHIAAMRRALDTPEAPAALQLPVVEPARPGVAPPAEEPTRLAQRLSRGEFVISVEIDPPRGFSTHRLLAGAQLLGEAGAHTLNVADSPMARMRMSPWAVCHLIQHDLGLESVLHFPTRGRNLLRIQGDLLAAHALGVRDLFVVMGDPTAIGDYPEAMDDYDVAPSGLIRLIKQNFNVGVDQAGADIGGETSFVVGCALNLGAPDLAREAGLLHRKVEAGADFVLTQPVYDESVVHRFRSHYVGRFGPLTAPLLVGILPLYSQRHAAFLANEVPGIHIPPAVRRSIEGAGARASEEGIHLAQVLIEALAGEVQGIYLMPPFQRYDLAAEVIDH